MGCWVDHFDLKGRGVFKLQNGKKNQFNLKINNDKIFFKFFHFISFSILRIYFIIVLVSNF